MATARVLLVEDELLIRLVTAEMLRDEGFEVYEAQHGDEARALLIDLTTSTCCSPTYGCPAAWTASR